MRVAIIVADATHFVNAGMDVVRTVRMFELPQEIADYIRNSDGQYMTVTLALEEEQNP